MIDAPAGRRPDQGTPSRAAYTYRYRAPHEHIRDQRTGRHGGGPSVVLPASPKPSRRSAWVR
ncbi:hypothetical protein ACFQVA_25675 [Actinomadura keratinilytica]